MLTLRLLSKLITAVLILSCAPIMCVQAQEPGVDVRALFGIEPAPPPEAAIEPAPLPEPEKTWEDKPVAALRALDKVTAKTISFNVKVGDTARFGDLYIKVQSCREPPAIFLPESAAFLQIWDVPAGQSNSRWVFSGWMFASSPALSAMDHPIYDVWVMDCQSPNEPKPAQVKIIDVPAEAEATQAPLD